MEKTMRKGDVADSLSQARKDSSGFTIDSKYTTGGMAKGAYEAEGSPEVGRGAEEKPQSVNKG